MKLRFTFKHFPISQFNAGQNSVVSAAQRLDGKVAPAVHCKHKVLDKEKELKTC
jgi:hypothetical protein